MFNFLDKIVSILSKMEDVISKNLNTNKPLAFVGFVVWILSDIALVAFVLFPILLVGAMFEVILFFQEKRLKEKRFQAYSRYVRRNNEKVI